MEIADNDFGDVGTASVSIFFVFKKILKFSFKTVA